MGEHASEKELVPHIVLRPQHDAFVFIPCAGQAFFAANQLFQLALVYEPAHGFWKGVHEEAGHQFVAIRSCCHGTHAIGNRVLKEVADKSSVLQRLLDVRPATDVQCLHVAIRSGTIRINGETLPLHRRDVRVERRPTRKSQLMGNDELRVREFQRFDAVGHLVRAMSGREPAQRGGIPGFRCAQ